MLKTVDLVALWSAAAMRSQKAESYPPETYVIDLAERRQIIWDMQGNEDAISPRA